MFNSELATFKNNLVGLQFAYELGAGLCRWLGW